MKSIEGKSALITGAASGIGRALTFELARSRVNLFLVDRDQAALAALADEARETFPNVVAHAARHHGNVIDVSIRHHRFERVICVARRELILHVIVPLRRERLLRTRDTSARELVVP